ALDEKLGYPLMIISKYEYLTHLVPRGLVLLPVVVDGDTEVSVSLGEISSKGKKSWESDIGDCDNTRYGGKITGGEIGKIPSKFSPFYNMKDIQAFYAKELHIHPPVILPPYLVLSQSPISDSQDFFPFGEISPKDTETFISPSSSVGSSSPIRAIISPLDYPFDESIFTKLDNSLWITPRPLGEEPALEELDESNTHL
nr:hypothetical protein [Tanacetum cinerariifolium]